MKRKVLSYLSGNCFDNYSSGFEIGSIIIDSRHENMISVYLLNFHVKRYTQNKQKYHHIKTS